MSTLLEKALAIPAAGKRSSDRGQEGELDLAWTFFGGSVSANQLCEAAGLATASPNSSASQWCIGVFRRAVRSGAVVRKDKP